MGTTNSKKIQKKEGFDASKPSFGTMVGGSSSSCMSMSCLCFCAFLIVAVIFGVVQTQFINKAGDTISAVGSTPEGAAALGSMSGSLLGKPGATVARTTTVDKLQESIKKNI